MRHLVSIKDLSKEDMDYLVDLARSIKSDLLFIEQRTPWWWSSSMKNKIMASIFYEPSTRTRHSFESAMIRLGGNVIGTENAAEFSSAIKGENLGDTIKVESGFADLIVLRHSEKGSASLAAGVSDVPVINAGDGAGEHPTQALVDLFTIRSSFEGRNRPLTVTIAGDLLRGRTVHSLIDLLPTLNVGKVNFVAPVGLQISKEYETSLNSAEIETELWGRFTEDLVRVSDVVYITRVQEERPLDPLSAHTTKTLPPEWWTLTEKLAVHLPEDSIVMHPLPRNKELPSSLDSLPQAMWFEQARNGLPVRMAIILWVMQWGQYR